MGPPELVREQQKPHSETPRLVAKGKVVSTWLSGSLRLEPNCHVLKKLRPHVEAGGGGGVGGGTLKPLPFEPDELQVNCQYQRADVQESHFGRGARCPSLRHGEQ